MRTLFLLSLLSTSATAAPVPKELKKQGSIVGAWKLESFTVCGKADKVDADQVIWTINDKFALTTNGQKSSPLQLKIDTAAKEFDYPLPTSLGRYEVCGDRLTICVSRPSLPRPMTLVPNMNNYVWVFRRADEPDTK